MLRSFIVIPFIAISLPHHGNGSRLTTSCPADVRFLAANCLGKFEFLYMRHLVNGFEIMSGMDVEQVRGICSEMRSSSRCINQLKDRCPGDRHAEIMSNLKMYVNLILFCSRDNAMEEYALAQSCLQTERPHLLRCYQKRLPPPPPLEVTTRTTVATAKYCSSINNFLGCVVDHVSNRCDGTSSLVARGLARAAAPQSVMCTKARVEHIQLSNNNENVANIQEENYVNARRQMMSGRAGVSEGSAEKIFFPVLFATAVEMLLCCS